MRRYNRWGGNQKGSLEDPTRCIVEVAERGRSCLFYQCRHKRGKGEAPYAGLLCGIHAYRQRNGWHLDIPGAD